MDESNLHREKVNNPNFWVKFLYLIFTIFITVASLGIVIKVKAAQPAQVITYQGKLINAAGSSVTTSVSMKLVLYNSLNGGTPVYSAAGTVGAPSAITVTPVSGTFSVLMGDGVITNTVDPTIFENNQNLYLEVRVGSDILTPRKQISASPYAFNAMYLNGAQATSTVSSSTYIPISDASGNFSFNRVTTTAINISGTSTDATTTFNGNLTVIQDLVAKALKDNLGWIQNQAPSARTPIANNNGGLGGGATPQNITMNTSSFSFFDVNYFISSTTQFQGSVFDGRYIYLVPYIQITPQFAMVGIVVRYDTLGSFSATSSYSMFDMKTINSNYCGFAGAVFDGRYIYFVPQQTRITPLQVKSGLVVRYDTQRGFTDTNSYSSFDLQQARANATFFSGAVFNGRYVYFVPLNSTTSILTSYDTTQPFNATSSYSFQDLDEIFSRANVFARSAYDGRYLYFGSSSTTLMLRYDTNGLLTDSTAYSFFNFPFVSLFVSSTDTFAPAFNSFDSRYLYMYSSGLEGNIIARYDTSAAFNATSSYSYVNLRMFVNTSTGFKSSVFDGRYVTFVPAFYAVTNTFGARIGVHSGVFARYDTVGKFDLASSWSFFDSSPINPLSVYFYGSVFDGHYIYSAPSSGGTNNAFTRLAAYPGGVDNPQSINKLARGSDFFISSNGSVGIGTAEPVPNLTLYGTVSSTTGISIGTGNVTSSFDHSLGLLIASTTQNRQGLYRVDAYTGNTSVSGTLRVYGGVSGMGLNLAASSATTTITFNFANTNLGNGIVFDTNAAIVSSTAALYSWRNNGYRLMSLSASGTLDVFGSINAMNIALGTPGVPGDLSERVDVNETQYDTLQPGEVMTLDNTKSDTYERTVNLSDQIYGVIATNPTLVLGDGRTKYTKVITLLGRTPVKISLQNGPIKQGDPLTISSAEPGRAMKQTEPGATLGYALEDYTGSDDSVLALVRPGFGNGQALYNTSPVAANSNTPTEILTAVVEVLKKLGIWVENNVLHMGDLFATNLNAKEIQANTLCLGNTCVNANQLHSLMQGE